MVWLNFTYRLGAILDLTKNIFNFYFYGIKTVFVKKVSLKTIMASSISYRRNRDYTKSFKWTYELDKDLYQCYIKAKSKPRIGYMNRLKQYWDEKHPELNTFSSKNLRDHVSSIIKRKVVMETDFNIEHQDNVTESNNAIHNIINSVDNIGDEIIETSNSSTNISLEIATIKNNIRETLLATFENTLQYD